jgi:hypothetical protein
MDTEYENSPMGLLDKHYRKFIGPLDEKVWHSTDQKDVHIDVYQFAPSPERPFWTLLTSGMSFQPQFVPEDSELSGRTELIMYVHEVKGWMVNVLKGLAEMPFEQQTFIYWHHTVPNGKPMTANPSLLTSFFFMPPYFEDPPFSRLMINEEPIDILWMFPITENEREYIVKNGGKAFENLIIENEISQIVDEDRLSLI